MFYVEFCLSIDCTKRIILCTSMAYQEHSLAISRTSNCDNEEYLLLTLCKRRMRTTLRTEKLRIYFRRDFFKFFNFR